MITTTRILFDKVFGNQSGQACVDWAVEMLTQGYNGHYLAMLASMSRPLNDFEIAEYRDRALIELQIENITQDEAAHRYAVELLHLAYHGEMDLISTLCRVAEICNECGHTDDLYDFRLLYWAYDDLQYSDIQHYWEGANRSNIYDVIRDRIQTFLIATGNA